MLVDRIIHSRRTKNVLERALAGEAPPRLPLEEICMLISGTDDINEELMQTLVQACLRMELRASEKCNRHLGQSGTTYWVRAADLKRYLSEHGLNYERDCPLGRWLHRHSRKPRACEIDKRYIQLLCTVAWEINPSWKIEGEDGILSFIETPLLQETWKHATLCRWARAFRPTNGKAGRPRKEKVESDEK